MINPGIFGSSDDRKNKDLPKISETKNSTAEAIVENAKSAIAIIAVEILITERFFNGPRISLPELMQFEFELNMQLKEKEMQVITNRENNKEDRKDKRTKIQATQQSALIEQRQRNTGPQNFESSGNDILSGDFDLGSFDPR